MQENKWDKAFIILLGSVALTLLMALLAPEQVTPTSTTWDSPPPTPIKRPPRPELPAGVVLSTDGGQVFCGLEQGPVRLDIPPGFTTESGAEFHCDPSESLAGWNGSTGAWADEGYLIGFWPETVPIVKPLHLILEVDPSQAASVCDNCFEARYFDAGRRRWDGLPTTYNESIARISAEIDEFLPESGYPDFENRFLIALFTEPQAQPTDPSPTSEPVVAPSSGPTLSPTLSSSPTPSQTPPPEGATTTPPPAPSPAVPSTQPSPLPAAPPTTAPPSPTSQDSNSGLLLLLGLLVVVLLFAGILLFVILSRSKKRALQPGSTGQLILVQGQAEPASIALSRPLVRIGRIPKGNDVVVNDPPVSSHHAEIRAKAGCHAIRDLNSTNGTFVNGKQLTQLHPLHDGDRIVMGNTEWQYRLSGGTEALPRA